MVRYCMVGMLCYDMLCCDEQWYAMLCYATLRYATPYVTPKLSYWAMLRFAALLLRLRYVMLCYPVLCYAVPWAATQLVCHGRTEMAC